MNKKKPITILIIMILALGMGKCSDAKFYHYQPVNPPSGLELSKLDNGDYLLIFFSENRSNSRFGGFFIFISESLDIVLDITSENEAAYILEGSSFNIGIDTPVAILFSDNESNESVIDDYTIISSLPKDHITANSWLTLRAFLYDDSSEVLAISSAGNPVQIEP